VAFKLDRLGRRVSAFCGAMAVLCLLHGYSFAQTAPADTSQPIDATGGFLQREGAQPRFEGASKLSNDARMAMKEGRIFSVPHFSGSFESQGKAYPFTMVGAKPQSNGTTEVPVQIIPISLFFEEFVDETGAPIVLDASPVVPRVQASPNFRNAQYATGITQFADAVQRAQFYGTAGKDWHTLLGTPEILKPLRIAVPRGDAKVYRNPSTGVLYAIVDTDFFLSQLNTMIQMANLAPDALAIALTSNVFLSPQKDIKKCCVLGFHTSFDVGEMAQVKFVQTFIWASWVEQGILGPGLADVTPMSHEISEWMNNPFGSNTVPAWQVPNTSACQNNLETGDPLALMPNAGYPVLIDGFTYHPQNQVLMQWFQRGAASDAFEGAFSFPDQSLMTVASQACPVR
jgi:chitinase